MPTPTVGPEHIRTQNCAIADGDWHVLLQQNTVWRGGDFDIRSHKIADAASCPAERLCYGRDVHCPSFVTFRLVAGEFNSYGSVASLFDPFFLRHSYPRAKMALVSRCKISELGGKSSSPGWDSRLPLWEALGPSVLRPAQLCHEGKPPSAHGKSSHERGYASGIWGTDRPGEER